MEWFGLEGNWEFISFQPPAGRQRHLPLDQHSKAGREKSPLCFVFVEVREVSVSSPALSCWGVHGVPAPLTTTCALPPQFVDKALAHELLNLQGGPTCAYYLAMAWTYLLQEDFPRCEECLYKAIQLDPVVIPSVCEPRAPASFPLYSLIPVLVQSISGGGQSHQAVAAALLSLLSHPHSLLSLQAAAQSLALPFPLQHLPFFSL